MDIIEVSGLALVRHQTGMVLWMLLMRLSSSDNLFCFSTISAFCLLI